MAENILNLNNNSNNNNNNNNDSNKSHGLLSNNIFNNTNAHKCVAFNDNNNSNKFDDDLNAKYYLKSQFNADSNSVSSSCSSASSTCSGIGLNGSPVANYNYLNNNANKNDNTHGCAIQQQYPMVPVQQAFNNTPNTLAPVTQNILAPKLNENDKLNSCYYNGFNCNQNGTFMRPMQTFENQQFWSESVNNNFNNFDQNNNFNSMVNPTYDSNSYAQNVPVKSLKPNSTFPTNSYSERSNFPAVNNIANKI
jgi:hypothetical protein